MVSDTAKTDDPRRSKFKPRQDRLTAFGLDWLYHCACVARVRRAVIATSLPSLSDFNFAILIYDETRGFSCTHPRCSTVCRLVIGRAGIPSMDHHLRDSVEYHGRPWNDQFKFQDASLYQIATRFVYDVMDKTYTVSGRRQTYIRAFLFALSILNPSTAKSLYIS